jgi:putative DNA primase/helicase
MMTLAGLARALGGEVNSGAVSAPGPGHSKHDRSLRVFLDGDAPNGFRIHTLAGDDWRACRDHVRQLLGISPDLEHRQAPAVKSPPDDGERIRRALAIWSESGDIDGTPGLTYLANRGIDLGQLPPDLHRVIRWHPSCPWESGTHGCLIALYTDAITVEPRAIHRTAITATGEKVDRKALGPIGGCVIRLWPGESVTEGVVLAEGVETALSAATRIEHNATLLQPAWGTGCAANMAKFPVLAGIESLTLLVDKDASQAGEKAAGECSERWTRAGREVIRLVPCQSGDFNDIIGRRR